MVNLTGTVMGLFGLPVEGALVTLSGAKRYTDYTIADGSFLIPDIEPSTYSLTIDQLFYGSYKQQVTLLANTAIDVTLDPELWVTCLAWTGVFLADVGVSFFVAKGGLVWPPGGQG